MRIPVNDLKPQYVRWLLEYLEDTGILEENELDAAIYQDKYEYVSLVYKKNEICRIYNKKYPYFDNYVMIASRNHVIKIRTYRVINSFDISWTNSWGSDKIECACRKPLNKKEYLKFIDSIALQLETVHFIDMINEYVLNIKREREETEYKVEDYDKETQQ